MPVVSETERKLIEMHIDEIHNERWAEKLAALIKQKEDSLSPEEEKRMDLLIREHIKNRDNVDITRQEIFKKAL